MTRFKKTTRAEIKTEHRTSIISADAVQVGSNQRARAVIVNSNRDSEPIVVAAVVGDELTVVRPGARLEAIYIAGTCQHP